MPSESARYEVAKLQRIMVTFWGVRPIVKCSCPGGWEAQCEEAPLDSVRARQRRASSGIDRACEHAVSRQLRHMDRDNV